MRALQMDCLAHWQPSAFAQIGLFTTTMGRLTHWPPSTFNKFSLFVTDQSKSAQLVIRFVGRFMSSLLHDLQSTKLKKNLTTPLVTRWQSSTNYITNANTKG